MTITQLQYVLAVAEYQNFTKAAEKCFVTQPTLSMQIQKLEDELNIQIFDRGKKPIALTKVGEKLVIQAKNIVNESNRIKDIVDQEKGFIGGEFKLGIIPTIMPTLLPMVLKSFIKKYPKINLKIEELNTDEIITRIKDGYLDVAIAATPLENEHIKERVLYYEPFVGYVPKSHRLSEYSRLEPEQLELDDLLLLEDGHCFRDNVLNLCKALHDSESESFQIESGSFETLIKLSDEGLGMTLLPYLHSKQLQECYTDKLTHFADPKPAREVSLLYHEKELKIQITNALKDVIDSVVRGAIAFHDVKIVSPKK